MKTFRLALVLAALLPLAPLAVAGDDAAKPKEAAPTPRPYAIGDAVLDFSSKDLDGKEFTLAGARSIPAAKAWDAVKAAAVSAGAKDPGPKDAIDALSGVQNEGKPDADLRRAFLGAAGREFGLVPDAKASTEWKTLEDVAKWVERSASAPILLVVWSVGCPTSQAYAERIENAVAATGARCYRLACKYSEEPDAIKEQVASLPMPFRVLDDRDLAVCERLGGKRTPHCFVLDAKNVLRYSGTVDNDLTLERPEAARQHWLADALKAVAEGGTPDVLMTVPVG